MGRNDGAGRWVSLVAFGAAEQTRLDGVEVGKINADLTSADGGIDVTTASPLRENAGIAFQGPVKVGSFDIPGDLARSWLSHPIRTAVQTPRAAPVGKRTRCEQTALRYMDYRLRGRDAGARCPPLRDTNRARDRARETHARSRKPRGRNDTGGATARRFPRSGAQPQALRGTWRRSVLRSTGSLFGSRRRSCRTRAFTQSAATTIYPLAFSTLACTRYGPWQTHRCTASETTPPTTRTCFEAFPFPAGMTPADTAAGAPAGPLAEAIAIAARRLNELRENWLNPAERVDRVPETVPGFPDRITHPQARPRGRAEEAHADEPLQPAPGVARQRTQGARRGGGRRLRLGRLHARDARRRDPAPPAGVEH